jgi:hypothetical protein
MQVIVINEPTNLPRLLGKKSEAKRALEALKELNPHVADFATVNPGTVLLVPESLSLPDVKSSSIEGQNFDELRNEVLTSLDAAIASVASGYNILVEQGKEMTTVFKTDKALLDKQPDLRPQVDAANAVFKQDEGDAQTIATNLEALRRQVSIELDALAKLLA